LYFDASRIDILLWKNLQEQGELKQMVKESVSLESFNMAFNSCSLFHYFAHKPHVIQLIYDLYESEKSFRKLKPSEEYLPLQILNPDLEGKSALYRAVSQ